MQASGTLVNVSRRNLSCPLHPQNPPSPTSLKLFNRAHDPARAGLRRFLRRQRGGGRTVFEDAKDRHDRVDLSAGVLTGGRGFCTDRGRDVRLLL